MRATLISFAAVACVAVGLIAVRVLGSGDDTSRTPTPATVTGADCVKSANWYAGGPTLDADSGGCAEVIIPVAP